MLLYYIISCGHHPFGRGGRCEAKILDGKYTLEMVEDEQAKDLIKCMIHTEPSERPTVKQALRHPYFWNDYRKTEYLRKIGNLPEVHKFREAEGSLLEEIEKFSIGTSFSSWIDKIPVETMDKMDKKRKVYTENTLALLRFIRNLYEHNAEDAKKIDPMGRFPDLFAIVYMFAKAKGWNNRPSLWDFLNASA